MTRLDREVREGLFDPAPRSRYSSLEKAMLGVRTDKEVEEAHRRRAESTRQSVEADRQRKTIMVESPKGTRSYIRIEKTRNPYLYLKNNAPNFKYIGTVKPNTSGHYISDKDLGLYKEDKPIQLYDPAPRKPSAWLNFVKAHKHMKNKKGMLDLKGIAKLWHEAKKKHGK